MNKKMIGIMIVDDHAMVSSGLRLIIENEHDMKVVGEAGTGEAAIEMATKLNPDIIIMDIALPDMNGVEATERILGICPSTRIIALTMYPEEAYLEAFIKAGGLGYVPKSAADRNLITTIRSVAAGEFVLGQNGVQIITRKFQELSRRHSSFEPLSKRESEVLAEAQIGTLRFRVPE